MGHAKAALESSMAAAPHAGLDYVGVLEILGGLQEDGAAAPVGLVAIGDLPEYIGTVKGAVKEVMIAELLERAKFDADGYLAATLAGAGQNGSPGAAAAAAGEDELEALAPAVTGLCRIEALVESAQVLYRDIQVDMGAFIT